MRRLTHRRHVETAGLESDLSYLGPHRLARGHERQWLESRQELVPCFHYYIVSYMVQALWLFCQALPFTSGTAVWWLSFWLGSVLTGPVPPPSPPNLLTLSHCGANPLLSLESPSILLPPCSPFSNLDHWFPHVQWSLHNTTPAWWVCTKDCQCIASGRYRQLSKRKRDRYLCPSPSTGGEQVTRN